MTDITEVRYSEDRTSFFINGDSENTFPRYGRMWFEWDIDTYDMNGEILPFKTDEELVEEARQQRLIEGKALRDSMIASNITLFGVDWQVDATSCHYMNETIAVPKRTEVSAAEAVNWILADNTIRQTTVTELEEVLNANATRMSQIFDQYCIWREGDLETSFADFLNPA